MLNGKILKAFQLNQEHDKDIFQGQKQGKVSKDRGKHFITLWVSDFSIFTP